MDQNLTKQKRDYIGNAIKSLYQLIVLVEDGFSCHVIDCNPEFKNLEIEQITRYDGLYSAIYKNTHPEDRDFLVRFSNIDCVDDILSQQIYVSCECRIRHSDFKYYWSRLTVCNAHCEDNFEGNEYLILLQDIHLTKTSSQTQYHELVQAMGALRKDYDSLFIENMKDFQTGCYNRKGLKYFEAIALKDATENGKYMFVCVLDLNGLKYLNDTYGHGAGDIALSVVADALKKTAPKGSYIIRTGGDEFLVFGALDKASTEPDEFCRLLEIELNTYNNSHNNPYQVSASYGYVFLPIHKEIKSLDEYIESADEKMYQMKELTDPYKR